MTIDQLMQEYHFEIDDIRWYLCEVMAERILSMKERKEDLIRFIWAGTLENDLYDMEERFLKDLQDQKDRGLTDETRIRDMFAEIDALKRKRETQR